MWMTSGLPLHHKQRYFFERCTVEHAQFFDLHRYVGEIFEYGKAEIVDIENDVGVYGFCNLFVEGCLDVVFKYNGYDDGRCYEQDQYNTKHNQDHAKRFFATVSLNGREYGTGEGRSKKQAEQAAARVAWEVLRDAGAA